MNHYNYQLERYNGPKSRFTCPECGNKKVYTRYIATKSGEHADIEFGRCNREIKCGYHKWPTSKGQMNYPVKSNFNRKPTINSTPTYLDKSLVFASQKYLELNKFVYFLYLLSAKCGIENLNRVIDNYLIGSSNKWPGATVFWQIDKNLKVRTGKIMLYNPETGKRVKHPYNHISWVHKEMKIANFNLEQCLFGEHLIKAYPNKEIGIVESEKTAIICSMFYPEYNWLATGGLSNLTNAKLASLGSRKITLFPDLGAEEKWKSITKEKLGNYNINISSMLTEKANPSEFNAGYDLADWIYSSQFNITHTISPEIY